ncbi:hypothetical protein TNCV_56481 [Trichonephila clavipes]|nr:hypothetical protein TNCV_56481 [Trichonephila clavipes]
MMTSSPSLKRPGPEVSISLCSTKAYSHNPWDDGVLCYLLRQKVISSHPPYIFNCSTICSYHPAAGSTILHGTSSRG